MYIAVELHYLILWNFNPAVEEDVHIYDFNPAVEEDGHIYDFNPAVKAGRGRSTIPSLLLRSCTYCIYYCYRTRKEVKMVPGSIKYHGRTHATVGVALVFSEAPHLKNCKADPSIQHLTSRNRLS